MKQVIKKYIVSTILSLSIAHVSFADVNSDMNGFFNSIGYSANVNKPMAYEAQGSGYFSGGSMYLRNGVRNIQFVHVDLPSVDAGCGGINLFLGGFSFINSKELINMGKQVLAGAAGYLFQLAMQTELPNVTQALNTMQDWARKINSMSMNTCQLGQSLVQSIPWKMQGMHNQICKDIGARSGKFKDWAAGIQECKDSNTNRDMNNKNPNSDENLTNTNIVWNYIHKSQTFSSNIDKALAEVFMSISGTVIFDQDGNMTQKFPLVNNDMLDKMINGGTISQVYHCNDARKCLDMTTDPLDINKNAAFITKVMEYLNNIQKKVRDDSVPLTPAEKSFLSMASLPVMKMMQTSLEAGVPLNINKYAEIIATDIVLNYIQGTLDYVKSKVPLKYTDEVNHMLSNSYRTVQLYINNKQTQLYQRLAAEQQIINSAKMLQEQVAASTTSAIKKNMAF